MKGGQIASLKGNPQDIGFIRIQFPGMKNTAGLFLFSKKWLWASYSSSGRRCLSVLSWLSLSTLEKDKSPLN
jgi:hypothetical protein